MNNIKIIYGDINKVIQIPKNYHELIEIISAYFNLNEEDLKRVKINYTNANETVSEITNNSDYKVFYKYAKKSKNTEVINLIEENLVDIKNSFEIENSSASEDIKDKSKKINDDIKCSGCGISPISK